MQSEISVVDPVYIVKYYVHLKLVLLLIACEQCLSLINLKFQL